ncbi:PIG-L deacetylase family protein [Flavobacterium sp. RNTU_13]|uniref:PIG-L deacetylase family protein n=1 Tax=Flavobacterium sp. RNTU_13 TaxID=3375145 RepID=UPI00398773FD
MKEVLIIVAHPDDEILWVGGTLLEHPDWNCFIISMCRKNDPDRAPKFDKVLYLLHARGAMGDLDDGPEQVPQDVHEIQSMLLTLLPVFQYDLVITHSPFGEYTRHLRHEEIGAAVVDLWCQDKISCKQLFLFAYEDGNKQYYPKPISSANLYYVLHKDTWQKKYHIIVNVYGFDPNTWEAETTPKAEAFWVFKNKTEAVKWLKEKTKL